MLGSKHSETSKEKMSAYQSNRINHPVKGFSTRVEDTQTGSIFLYNSLREAGKGLKVTTKRWNIT